MKYLYVDEYLMTSQSDVYAVGDAIEYPHPITGKPWLNFLAGPANRQARIVADNMVFGNRIKYEGSVGTAIAKVFDMTVASTGLPAKRLKQFQLPYLSATIHSGSHAGYYPGSLQMDIKITFSPEDGRLYGAQIVGYDGVDKRIDEYALVVKRGGTVYDLTELGGAMHLHSSSANPVAVGLRGRPPGGKRLSPLLRELRDADLSGVTLVDVRTADEYALGRIPGAVVAPLTTPRCPCWKSRPTSPYGFADLLSKVCAGTLVNIPQEENNLQKVRNLIGGLKTYKAAIAPLPSPEDYAPTCGGGCSAPKENTECRPARVLKLDACGLQCPGPVLKLKQHMDNLKPGERRKFRLRMPDSRATSKPGAGRRATASFRRLPAREYIRS